MNWPVDITTTVSVSHTQVILLMWRVLRPLSYFTTHLLFSVLVKEFLKLVNIWQSYGQNG